MSAFIGISVKEEAKTQPERNSEPAEEVTIIQRMERLLEKVPVQTQQEVDGVR
jgi:chromatin segregation and condensation protein Rec8/ScpA/Scc1 (kleisin family)